MKSLTHYRDGDKAPEAALRPPKTSPKFVKEWPDNPLRVERFKLFELFLVFLGELARHLCRRGARPRRRLFLVVTARDILSVCKSGTDRIELLSRFDQIIEDVNTGIAETCQ